MNEEDKKEFDIVEFNLRMAKLKNFYAKYEEMRAKKINGHAPGEEE